MIHALLRLASILAPSALAANIEALGSREPSITAMWGVLKDTFPHTNVGSAGVAFIAVKITHIIINTIGGLAVVVILWGAIRIITGGEEGITEGKKILLYAVLGLIAAMCADAVVIYTCYLVWEGSGGGAAPLCPTFW